MEERVDVLVNGSPQSLYRGMQVRHALVACDQELYEAALAGAVAVEDENGFALDLEGELTRGMRIRTKPVR